MYVITYFYFLKNTFFFLKESTKKKNFNKSLIKKFIKLFN